MYVFMHLRVIIKIWAKNIYNTQGCEKNILFTLIKLK